MLGRVTDQTLPCTSPWQAEDLGIRNEPMIIRTVELSAGLQNAAQAEAGFPLLFLVMGVLGGLALFLFGLEKLADSLQALAGDRMKSLLTRLTKNRFLGILTGAFVTSVIQSSSITTVLVVGFVSAGLMTMTQSIGVIMGANIGTTVTAQIIAFKVTRYALILVALGFAALFFGKRERLRQQGMSVLSLGLLFMGMGIMGDAMAPLRDYEPFLHWMAGMENPAMGILAGALFTALVQSSSATTGVVIVLAGQGFITLPAGIALAFGANVGTCVTALLAAVGKHRDAVRAALVHVLFNVLGVLVWLAFIDQLAQLVAWFSPTHPELFGLDRLAAETPRQIANAHTVFNVANTLLFIGFAGQLARLVERFVPDRPADEEREFAARYLDPGLLGTPSLALDRVRLEILHLGDLVRRMFRAILPALVSGTEETLQEIQDMDTSVDLLHGQIVQYLGEISQTALTAGQTEEFIKLMATANDLENVGDVIETRLVHSGLRRIAEGITISATTTTVIREFHAAIGRALEWALHAVTQKNEEAARMVIDMKEEINRLADSAALHEAKRLVAKEPKRLPTYALEVDMLEDLKRVYYFCKRMAKVAVPESRANPPPAS